MNILFYCNEYPPAKTGGIGSVTKIIAESLAKCGHCIYIVGYYPNNSCLPFYSNINNVNVYRLNLGYRNGNIKYYMSLFLCKFKLMDSLLKKELIYTENFIEKLILEKNIDILELTDFYDFNLSSKPLPFKKFSIPTVLRIHGSMSFLKTLMGKYSVNVFRNDKLHFLRCNYVSAVSEYSLRYVEENFSTDHFILKQVIYNPLEENFLSKTPGSENKTILFIGKLIETKGCYSLLKAFNIIASQHHDWRLVLIGGGNIHKAKSYIKSDYLYRVEFLGYCSRKRIKEEIDKCAFACIPSYFETFGLVATEVMARQRTLIFTNRTSGPEIIDNGKDGFSVNPENVKDIADAMTELIINSSLRNKMAENAFLKIKRNFTTSVILSRIIEYYEYIIQIDSNHIQVEN